MSNDDINVGSPAFSAKARLFVAELHLLTIHTPAMGLPCKEARIRGYCRIQLYNQIQTAQQTRPRENAQPEEDIAHQSLTTHEPRPAQRDERELRHLEEEQVASQAPENTQHDQLVNARREKECH